MTEQPSLQPALSHLVQTLGGLGRDFALVGGLAVSIRAEVRFTRDVDMALAVVDDADAEGLVFALGEAGYQPVATVEHEDRGRLSTVRLLAPAGVVVDLLFASCGIEAEIVEGATEVEIDEVATLRVARAEELLAMKVLSMSERRLQDRLDAQNLVRFNPELDLDSVKDSLARIEERGYHRGQDLPAKLDELLCGLDAEA